jgi:hypothetical protein
VEIAPDSPWTLVAEASADPNGGRMCWLMGFYDYNESWRNGFCYWQVPLHWLTLGIWYIIPTDYPCDIYEGRSVEATNERKRRVIKTLQRAAKATDADLVVLTDVLSPLDVKLLTFNPYHLRVIAASRKKTDKRDAFWLARTVQSMTPHPVYIPTGIVRQLRALLNERDTVAGQRKAWLVRAVTLLRAAGLDERQHSGKGWIEKLLQQPDGIDERIDWSVLLPARQHVPSHLGEPEHEWKDENPWPSAPDLSDLSDNPCQNRGAPASESAAAKVRSETLTRIMEGRPNAIGRRGPSAGGRRNCPLCAAAGGPRRRRWRLGLRSALPDHCVSLSAARPLLPSLSEKGSSNVLGLQLGVRLGD